MKYNREYSMTKMLLSLFDQKCVVFIMGERLNGFFFEMGITIFGLIKHIVHVKTVYNSI